MLSYTGYRNLAAKMVGNNSSATLTFLDELINQSLQVVASANKGAWWWLEEVKTLTTLANIGSYQIPNTIRKIMDLYVTVGTTIYTPRPIEDETKWKLILRAQLGSTDVAMYFYHQASLLMIQPLPGSSGNTITFRGRRKFKPLSIADYTTGTITSIASGATTVTGNGTTWTDLFVGRFLMIPAAQGGDGIWYEIATRTSNTVIELLKPYEGTSIAAATATYTIGEMGPIPEPYDVAPLYRAIALYWTTQGDPMAIRKSEQYWRMFDGGVEAGLTDELGGIMGQMALEQGEKVEGPYIEPFERLQIPNPNFPPTGINPSSFA